MRYININMDPKIKKPMTIMLICLGVLFGGIFIYHGIGSLLFKRFLISQQSPVVTVSATKIVYADWQSLLKATGSLRAVRGVNVTTELAGMIQSIYFTPGADVTENTTLVQLNADADMAKLDSLRAIAALAKITYERDKKQYGVRAVSKQTLDTDEANLQSAIAQVDEQIAIVAKKRIKAPFTGRLGISRVNPGQYINPGDTVVTLQTLNPIYVDFYLPQQALAKLKTNQVITLTADTFPGKKWTGKITTINPMVNTDTRNVEVEATIENPRAELTPGMFAAVEIDLAAPQRYLTLPQTAVSFNSYGEIIFLVKEKGKDENGKSNFVAEQAFVTTGETRGEKTSILNGAKAGDMVVTSGQLKLKNGSRIAINNTVQPMNQPLREMED